MAFRSKFERSVAASLSSRGIKYNYETVKWPWRKKQVINKHTRALHKLATDFIAWTFHVYILDFEIPRDDGTSLYVEAKGRWVSSDRNKIITLVKDGYNIHMLLQSDNKINPGSKTRYSDICKKNGIPYHVGICVPQKWINKDQYD